MASAYAFVDTWLPKAKVSEDWGDVQIFGGWCFFVSAQLCLDVTASRTSGTDA